MTITDILTKILLPFIVSLIGSGAMWAFLTGKRNANIGEKSKRAEQIRIKATTAGEELLRNSSEFLVKLESVLFYLKATIKKTLSEDDIANGILNGMQNEASQMHKLLYSTSIYTTDEIRDKINKTINILFEKEGLPLEIEKLENFISQYRKNHFELSQMFFNRYVSQDII